MAIIFGEYETANVHVYVFVFDMSCTAAYDSEGLFGVKDFWVFNIMGMTLNYDFAWGFKISGVDLGLEDLGHLGAHLGLPEA